MDFASCNLRLFTIKCLPRVDEEDEDDEDEMEGEDDETEEEAVDRIRGEISDRYDTDMQVISQLQVI